jgi:hypothetical protein
MPNSQCARCCGSRGMYYSGSQNANREMTNVKKTIVLGVRAQVALFSPTQSFFRGRVGPKSRHDPKSWLASHNRTTNLSGHVFPQRSDSIQPRTSPDKFVVRLWLASHDLGSCHDFGPTLPRKKDCVGEKSATCARTPSTIVFLTFVISRFAF